MMRRHKSTDRITEILATWFFTGYSPVAPGTCGTAGAVLFYLLFMGGVDSPVYLTVTAVVTVVAVFVSSRTADLTGDSDPSRVVIDEVAGYLVTMAFIPYDIVYVITGFILFRIFDILKPFPARRLEALPGGYGIVFDDLAAGVWSNVLMHIIYIYLY